VEEEAARDAQPVRPHARNLTLGSLQERSLIELGWTAKLVQIGRLRASHRGNPYPKLLDEVRVLYNELKDKLEKRTRNAKRKRSADRTLDVQSCNVLERGSLQSVVPAWRRRHFAPRKDMPTRQF
jgi:hypothetical protein